MCFIAYTWQCVCPSGNKIGSTVSQLFMRCRLFTDCLIFQSEFCPKTINFFFKIVQKITWKWLSHPFYILLHSGRIDTHMCARALTATVLTVWSLFTYNKYLLVFTTNTRFFIIIWFVWSFHFNMYTHTHTSDTQYIIIHFPSCGFFLSHVFFFLFLLLCLYLFIYLFCSAQRHRYRDRDDLAYRETIAMGLLRTKEWDGMRKTHIFSILYYLKMIEHENNTLAPWTFSWPQNFDT